MLHGDRDARVTWLGTGDAHPPQDRAPRRTAALLDAVVFVFFLFFANFLIFMGPMMLMGISQIRGYEPGDAEWGVKLERRPRPGRGEGGGPPRRHALAVGRGVRARRRQARARPALPRRAGHRQDDAREGDRDGFNSPFVSIPGSGFAQTFIGIDAIIVRFLARKAKKLARKWGGQCIVFIDEIDAVGMRRQALGGGAVDDAASPTRPFYGPWARSTRAAT